MTERIDINLFTEPVILLDSEYQLIKTNQAFTSFFSNGNSLEQTIELIRTRDEKKNQEFLLFIYKDKEFIIHIYSLAGQELLLCLISDSTHIEDAAFSLSSIQSMKDEFLNMLSVLHDDFVIIDRYGVIVSAMPNFETMYGISRQEAIGKTIFEMEEKKIFNPSVAIRVFKSGNTETLLQLTGAGKYLMCTAIPIKDKDGNIEKVVSYTRDITKYQTLKDEYENLEDTLKLYSAEIDRLRNDRDPVPSIIGRSQVIKNISATLLKISRFDANVLFLGESGVGKTMFAKIMHSQSGRSEGPFIEINCGAIPESLLESELFGYEKGAFSGASKEGKPGLIELANEGTLFLDEIGDLPLHMQVKLLKAIQEKKIIRLGGANLKEVDFRLIAATNKNLEKLVHEGSFREDLYYRLNVITIKIPGLRDRKEDIFTLANHFVNVIGKKYGLKRTLSGTVIDYLVEYDWPGNIRELENLIERMILTSDDYMISEEQLPTKIKASIFHTASSSSSLKDILESVERRLIIDAYKKHGTSTGVAAELNISQPSASNKINKYIKETEG